MARPTRALYVLLGVAVAVLHLHSAAAGSCGLQLAQNFDQYGAANIPYTRSLMQQDFPNTTGPYKGTPPDLAGTCRIKDGSIYGFFPKGADRGAGRVGRVAGRRGLKDCSGAVRVQWALQCLRAACCACNTH